MIRIWDSEFVLFLFAASMNVCWAMLRMELSFMIQEFSLRHTSMRKIRWLINCCVKHWTPVLSIVSWAIRVAMLKWWTSKSMLYGTYFKSVISVTVLFPIPVCPVMWSFPSVFARLMMHWSLRRLTVWMVACCLLPCFVLLI